MTISKITLDCVAIATYNDYKLTGLARSIHKKKVIKMANFKITHVQLFDYAYERQVSEDGDFEIVYSYSANLVINDSFIVQISGNLNECSFDGICDSNDAFWSSDEKQDEALENFDSSDVREALESNGFENNIGWLEDNADEVVNPENAIYRHDNSDS